MKHPGRGWLLAPAALCLLAGLDAGLVRLGGPTPVASDRLGDVHGPVMVLGFLGTLVALERAVALRRTWAFAAPVLLGAGGLALVVPLPPALGHVLLLDGTVALVAVLVALWGRRRDDAVLVEVLGGGCALVAALLMTRVEVSATVPLLAGFVVLTIAAERVELAALHLPAGAGRTLALIALPFATSAALSTTFRDSGARVYGAVLLLLVAWLAPRDVAVRLVRASGFARFAATAMLAAYAWLGVAGAAWVAVGSTSSAGARDVVVHCVFLGFAMSMVMAHAPVILPAVLRRPLPWHPLFWLPLGALHATLLLRVTGDVTGTRSLGVAGGTGTAVALLLLPLTALAASLLVTRRPAPAPATPRRVSS
ncbi:hypothetical protein [Phycicoccus sp.]|uniref:hypothetical protein n=1 Tax=Phycicoccus sp. TaxID=1902410 RepID=UPI002CC6B216|nr:hypothetical protein [Phycicoccus sp.]HMM94980.1 hypothetical protein [Phycicoccus sp.]